MVRLSGPTPGSVIIRSAASLAGAVTPPGAKSGTVRALLCATLAHGTSTVLRPGDGANIAAMAAACEHLGASIDRASEQQWTIVGAGGRLPEECELSAGNSGIVLRLLAAVGAHARRWEITSAIPESLGKRGNAELAKALGHLGAYCHGQGVDTRPPLVVGRHGGGGASGGGRGGQLRGGTVHVSVARSTQFLSGLLYLAPLAGGRVEIHPYGSPSAPGMVRTTLAALATAGITVEHDEALSRFTIPVGQAYHPARFAATADGSSAAGLLAAAAVVPGSHVRIMGFHADGQGSDAMAETAARMGADVRRHDTSVTVRGSELLRAVHVDGSRFPDGVLPLAALACYARGTSVFYNVQPLRYKECDRISDFLRQLAAAGAEVSERHDAIIIHGTGRLAGGAAASGCHDHAVVMALAVAGLRADAKLRIDGAGAVAQTYPGFFAALAALGAPVEVVEPPEVR